ncbi:hypothetical protein M378DRAFT_923071 [Amanita muscaria Koide BX008]|uniref:Uncharacterized protein n=1 Tax=Amanita muscaria (strain Koide BX008) TaxID=946122 RepID=A0A0C2WFZ1_AMAMK|nr:hypothetical protein M378DRAFT_923071 [Amanita muscaria Koide BX008]
MENNQPSSHNTNQVAKSFENAHNFSMSQSNVINATGNVTVTSVSIISCTLFVPLITEICRQFC